MMHYVYVLHCTDKTRSKFYIGSCSDLKKRFKEHNQKSVQTTKSYEKIELVYYEASLSKKDARIRELKLKTGFGRGYIKARLSDYLNNKRD